MQSGFSQSYDAEHYMYSHWWMTILTLINFKPSEYGWGQFWPMLRTGINVYTTFWTTDYINRICINSISKKIGWLMLN